MRSPFPVVSCDFSHLDLCSKSCVETLETRKGLIPKEKAGSDVTILKYRKEVNG